MEELTVVTLEPAYEDDRGAIYDLLDGETIRHVGLLTSAAESIRGNHYHREQKQWMYIVEGEINLLLQDRRGEAGADAPVERVRMANGDMIYIPPEVVHTIEARADTTFLDFNDRARGPQGEGFEADTVRVKDLSERV